MPLQDRADDQPVAVGSRSTNKPCALDTEVIRNDGTITEEPAGKGAGRTVSGLLPAGSRSTWREDPGPVRPDRRCSQPPGRRGTRYLLVALGSTPRTRRTRVSAWAGRSCAAADANVQLGGLGRVELHPATMQRPSRGSALGFIVAAPDRRSGGWSSLHCGQLRKMWAVGDAGPVLSRGAAGTVVGLRSRAPAHGLHERYILPRWSAWSSRGGAAPLALGETLGLALMSALHAASEAVVRREARQLR